MGEALIMRQILAVGSGETYTVETSTLTAANSAALSIQTGLTTIKAVSIVSTDFGRYVYNIDNRFYLVKNLHITDGGTVVCATWGNEETGTLVTNTNVSVSTEISGGALVVTVGGQVESVSNAFGGSYHCTVVGK